jgi:ketosteroid isomerase-like protein
MERRELIVAAFEAANHGDLAQIGEFIHDDFLGVVPPDMSAEPDTYAGPAGAKRYFDLWRETVDDLDIRFDAFEDLGDWTIATGAVSGRGRVSGLPVSLTVALATQFRDGKLFRSRAFPDLETARAELHG